MGNLAFDPHTDHDHTPSEAADVQAEAMIKTLEARLLQDAGVQERLLGLTDAIRSLETKVDARLKEHLLVIKRLESKIARDASDRTGSVRVIQWMTALIMGGVAAIVTLLVQGFVR